MDIGIGVSEDLTLDRQRQVAHDVEAGGFRSLWTNEARGRDALITCHAWGRATERLEVGVAVAPIWTRTPAQLAMATATLQEDLDGRFLLGLGVSHPATMGPWHGADYRRPVTAAREALQIIRQIASGDEADTDGEVFSSRRFRLEIAAAPPAPRLYLAAMGPTMLGVSGELADGVLLNWCTPEGVRRSVDRVHEAGPDTEVAAYVRVAVHPERNTARRALARELGRYCALPAYAEHLGRQGHGATVDKVKDAYKSGGSDAIARALDDETLLEFGWYGTPDDDPGPALARYRDAGLDHLVARVVVADEDTGSAVAAAVAALPGHLV
ncbi:MAG: LLM class flavin-dependent oxidoreductase [Nitriliruptorales bacterium]|nr:LLM class flavin-dependent oxidoreductase [Nitriliruptorales bacterium]